MSESLGGLNVKRDGDCASLQWVTLSLASSFHILLPALFRSSGHSEMPCVLVLSSVLPPPPATPPVLS